ncbi:helix-turn-helix domain-containing protein [Streptomyces sp. NPDC102274]|uniref:helix-turn-helix domain-containing protein n=1 Tax=Streptomyces sp. NPDC102274 TaxID=3366151 RepID=UPI00381D3ACF
MGRASSALAQHNPVETLARWLESLRRRSGMSWGQVAQTAVERGLSVTRSTLYRAAQGETLPKWKTVLAFTRVCGGDEREARRLWTSADRHEAARVVGAPRVVVLPPLFITEPWQLVHAMKDMCRANGSPTLRELEEMAYVDVENKVSLLPKSTVGAVLQGRMPARDLLLNFVRYCGNVPENRLEEWKDAWERVNAFSKGEVRSAVGEVQHELARADKELTYTRAQLEHTRGQLEEAKTALRRYVRGEWVRATWTGPTVVVLPPSKPVGAVPPPARSKNIAPFASGPPPQPPVRGNRRRGTRRTIRAG